MTKNIAPEGSLMDIKTLENVLKLSIGCNTKRQVENELKRWIKELKGA